MVENFWQERERAKRISQELADIKDVIEKWHNYESDFKHLNEIVDLLESVGEGDSLHKEFERSLQKLEEKIEKEKFLI